MKFEIASEKNLDIFVILFVFCRKRKEIKNYSLHFLLDNFISELNFLSLAKFSVDRIKILFL